MVLVDVGWDTGVCETELSRRPSYGESISHLQRQGRPKCPVHRFAMYSELTIGLSKIVRMGVLLEGSDPDVAKGVRTSFPIDSGVIIF